MSLNSFKAAGSKFGGTPKLPMAEPTEEKEPEKESAKPGTAVSTFTIPGSKKLPTEAPEETRWPGYVALVHARNKKLGEIEALYPGIQKGHPVILGDGRPKTITAADCLFLLNEREFYGSWNVDNELTGAALVETAGLAHVYECIWLVVHEGKCIPVSWRTRRAVANATEAMLRELVASQTVEWLTANPDHTGIEIERLRVMGTGLVGAERKSKSTGHMYQIAELTAKPASVEAVAAVVKWINDEEEQGFYEVQFMTQWADNMSIIDKMIG